MHSDLWEGSYTQEVAEYLKVVHIPGAYARQTADDAVALLEQYHRDLHVSYEQRDRARARVKELEGELLRYKALHGVAASTISDLRKQLQIKSFIDQKYTWTGNAAQQSMSQQQQKQFFTACQHYPNALSNFWEKRDSCEFCCEKEPLKWFDHGKHRMPGK